ncbi:MAG: amidase family protein [Gammaproteobacteria bacterium]|nr:amidase family protein [Gammaproteobacteria bacterium]MDH3535212.1 amidase family protein [Gammaproteobacteria bacterium]
MDELIGKSASEIVALLHSGELTVEDTLAALEARIAEVDGDVNALPTLCFERARAHARARDYGATTLGGIPVAIKDLEDVAGVRTTYGSMVYEHHIPDQSDLLVERIEANGGIVYAKSNTPEFGSGGNTFNDVFGATRNPYDLGRSAGGSSGGAAAALATGCAWLAQGSDLGGSLRTPASFCGVTSLRPSPGLIASSPGQQPFEVYAQKGPMARTIVDLALFADAMAGFEARAGLTKSHPQGEFRDAAAQPRKPRRIAFSEDLGFADTSAEVASICGAAIARLERENIEIVTAHPDLGMADRAFDAPRAFGYALSYGDDLQRIRDVIKPENVWNIELGMQLGNDEILDSMAAQGQIFDNASRFMQDYDLLICPASITTAYPVEERYPGYADGLEYPEYYRWLAIVYAITMTTLPVITIPCGKSAGGLPVGIQLIGKPHGERELFSYASYLEQVFGWDPLQRI